MRHRGNQAAVSQRPAWRPVSAWWWILAAVFALGITTAAVTVCVLAIADSAAPGTARAEARLDAVRIGLGAGGGAAAAVGLMLAFRRQHHQEVATVLTDVDATERRITELYTKAAEELGSDRAPVRLAGLYALERLAQANPDHRQTVVNVICAYLRMPFDHQPRLPMPFRPTSTNNPGPSPTEEAVARTTAQKIITDHLYTSEADTAWPRDSLPSSPNFWPGMKLDLAGAVLVDFTLQGKAEEADFTATRFVGGANFGGAEFDGHVCFRDAQFEGGSGHFRGAWFGLRAVFSDANFGNDEAVFDNAIFAGMTFFENAKFRGGVSLHGARALAEFNTNWGSVRYWPPGWKERPIAPDEEIAGEGRWLAASRRSSRVNLWNTVVSDDGDGYGSGSLATSRQTPTTSS